MNISKHTIDIEKPLVLPRTIQIPSQRWSVSLVIIPSTIQVLVWSCKVSYFCVAVSIVSRIFTGHLIMEKIRFLSIFSTKLNHEGYQFQKTYVLAIFSAITKTYPKDTNIFSCVYVSCTNVSNL